MISVFWASTAYALQTMLVVAGLVLLHFGNKQKAVLLKGAAAVALIGGVCGLIYTFFYSVEAVHHYHLNPSEEHPELGD